MPRQAILLRGINLGARNKVPMPALREALTESGLRNVKSYVQSGNLAVDSDLAPDELAKLVQTLVAGRFGVTASSVARSEAQMRAVIKGNPFPQPATNEPKFFAVTFLSEPLDDNALELIARRSEIGDAVAVSPSGCEVYAWHPGGIHISKLASQLTERKLGARIATARNWTTVLAVLALLEADA